MALERSKQAVKAHPAGATAGAGGILGGLLITWLQLTPEQAGVLTAAIGLAATAVSWTNSHGGLVGLWNDLLHGSDGEDA